MPPAASTASGFDGLVVVADGLAIEVRFYGADPDADGSLVSRAESAGHQAILVGRLYYRDDVVACWGAAPGARDSESDAALALRVYLRAGAAGLERLEGEFALIIVDAGRSRIVAMRDPLGGYPVYWCQRGDMMALGTSLRALSGLLPDPALDLGTLAEIMALSAGELDYHEDTVFQGIQRLVSGTVLTLDLTRGSAQTRRYWDWTARIADPGADDLDALGEAYADVLRAAVRQRLRGGVAAHVSGGMDSTSVALVAHDELARRGRHLQALSLVYERLDRLTEERPFVEAALDRPGLAAHRIVADDLLDFDCVNDAVLYDEPFAGLFRSRADIAMMDAAAAAGCATILTGMGADEVLDTAPFYIADLVWRGHPMRAWSEATRWARALDKAPGTFLRRFGLAPLMPAWLGDGVGSWLRRGRAAWGKQSPSTIAPWILPDFAAGGRLRERLHARRRRSFPPAPSIVLSDALGRLHHASGDWHRHSLAAPRGIHLAHPFRDPRVLAFGLGARERVRPTPHQQKPVLARAMTDVLPAVILRRRDKAHFNAVYYAGLARNLTALEDMVQASDVEDRGLFDKEILIHCLRDAALGYRSVASTAGLDTALIITKWLSLLPRWRQAPMTPTRVVRHDMSGLG